MAAVNFSGIASGIDSTALIKSLLDQERKVKISPLEQRISQLTETNSTFSKLNSLLETLKTKASAFRTINGAGLSKTGFSSDDSVVTASVSSFATGGTYGINVTQLAKNATFSFGSSAGSYSSESSLISSGAAFNDTVLIKIGNSAAPVDTVSINLSQSSTLSDFVTSFNSQTSNATAALVNVGTSSVSPDYRIVISSNQSGLAAGALDVTVGSSILSRGALDSNLKDDAKDAIFNISGIATGIVRSSNSVSDVITGVTLSLHDTGSATIKADLDSSASYSALKDLIDSFNAVNAYVQENDLITQEQSSGQNINIFGPLSGTTLDENLLIALRGSLTASSISAGLINTLSDLGVSTQRDGSLAFDENTFISAISSDPTSASKILENLGESLASTNGSVAQFTRFNGLIDLSESANSSAISSLNSRIGEIEKSLSRYQETLNKRFSALEVISGKLQSAQSALAGLIK